MNAFKYEREYFDILTEELVPALGCTEPISIAFAAAKAREILGSYPDKIFIQCSGSLIKNIKCVSVPNTENLIGIEASALAGMVGGDSSKNLEVLCGFSKKHIEIVKSLLQKKICTVELLKSPLNLHFIMRFEKGDSSCEIEIKNLHTNITRISKDDKIVFQSQDNSSKYYGVLSDRSILTIDNIIEFSESADLDRLKSVLTPQVYYNMKIAEEGLSGKFGVSIGSAIIKNNPSLFGKIKGYASAASEARMCGCELAVITNSGSGNQGIAASVPVIVYARENEISEEKMFRALALSNLLTIYQKTLIGRLSAFCGAVSACCGSGAAFTYMAGGSNSQIKMTIVNALADASGIVCDGAKASCGSKIATGLEAAIIAHFLAMEHKTYKPFTGFLRKDADDTISAVGRIASEGMKDTDKIILQIMMED